jgi:hypothetical protein
VAQSGCRSVAVACPKQKCVVTLDYGPTRLRLSDGAVSTTIKKSTNAHTQMPIEEQ